ncbi:hypothetical protein SLS55_000554 [Diplodia seriata]|uniref:Anaphase-promoting complex subunit 11 RING-H2 finger domain-containing protein n=1 Tax=Diplodia seriata TaxID=420778 RepID=A0ABR3CVM9_9PEZI
MKVKIKQWNAVAAWRWDMPEDDLCGICRSPYDSTCSKCKFPGDGCPLPHDDRVDSAAAVAAASQPLYLHDNAAGDAETLSYPPLGDDPSSQPLLPPANFSPFFTLVEDAGTGEHHHPAVHYVFSDDDPDLHTAVFMRALGDTTTTAPPSPTTTRHHPHHHIVDHLEPHEAGGGGVGGQGGAAAAGGGGHILPPPTPGVRERYVVVDLTPDGQAVAGATSLSRSWQVVGTSIGPAPSFGEDSGNEADGIGGSGGVGGALLLKVEGTDMGGGGGGGGNRGTAAAAQQQQQGNETVIAAGLTEARKAAGDDLVGGLEELLRRFDGGVDVLGKIVGPDVEVLVMQQQQQQQQQPPHEGDGVEGESSPPPGMAALAEVVGEPPA